jgi:hypothetical protein
VENSIKVEGHSLHELPLSSIKMPPILRLSFRPKTPEPPPTRQSSKSEAFAAYIGEKSPSMQIWTWEQMEAWSIEASKSVVPRIILNTNKSAANNHSRFKVTKRGRCDKDFKIGRFRYCPPLYAWKVKSKSKKIQTTKVLPARWIKILPSDATLLPQQGQPRLFPTETTAPDFRQTNRTYFSN